MDLSLRYFILGGSERIQIPYMELVLYSMRAWKERSERERDSRLVIGLLERIMKDRTMIMKVIREMRSTSSIILPTLTCASEPWA